MNDFEIAYNRQTNQMSLDLGIHTLHLWIRFFECLLHIGQRRRPGYNDSGFFHANTPEKKQIFASRKKEIQIKIKNTLGLVVDVPRSGGSGTSMIETQQEGHLEAMKLLLKYLELIKVLLKDSLLSFVCCPVSTQLTQINLKYIAKIHLKHM